MRRFLFASLVAAACAATAIAQDNTVQGHTAAARALAQKDPSGMVARAAGQCPGVGNGPTGVPTPSLYTTHFTPLPPTRVFDNLVFLGDEWVGAWVLQTSQGLILFDAFTNSMDASRYLTGDMPKLGLDPKQIKYVVVTHGHWDHFGGAGYVQSKFGAKILMSQADWQAVSVLNPSDSGIEWQIPPKKDMVMTDKTMDLTLGNTTVKLFLTPGHTPGTISALIPARDGAATHWMALWGGNAIPSNLEPNAPNAGTFYNAGLRRMDQSVREFRGWVSQNNGVGVIGSHSTGERETRFPALRQRAAGSPHPFVIGKERTQDYFAALDHCMQARMLAAGK